MRRFLGTAIAIVAALWLVPAHAASELRVDHVVLSLSLESPAKPGTTVWAAIRQVIDPGWHTYWRNPGDSGLATSVSWSLPKGVTAGEPLWPTPQRFTDGPIVNYGYAQEATLLVPLNVAENAASGIAHAKIFLLECEHMCIPEQAALDIDLSKASGTPPLFAAARAALPRAFVGSARVAVEGKTLTLTLTDPLLRRAGITGFRFFPATPRVVDDDIAPGVQLSGDTLTWIAARPAHAKPFSTFAGVLDVPGAGAFAVTASSASASPPAAADDTTLLEAVALALLGGLILNLMPCVLPILSMKALALARSGGNAHGAWRDGVCYFVGVLTTFGLIAGSLLLLKAGGAAIGWGFQLQSPLVVLGLALLMAAIGLNLLGVFEVPLRLAGVGNGLTRGGGGRGAFFTGALAVLVASPCTSPFMGTAMGFALTQPPLPAIGVFLALGVGFALPFSLLAVTPSLIRLVPRPGLWMVRFKQFLAFPMFATAIWLVWVLGHEAGPTAVALALAIGLGLVFLGWLMPLVKPPWRWIAGLVGVAGLVAVSLNVHAAEAVHTSGSWAPWSEQAVAEARHEGRPVLVDFSAAWCVTCLVNERVALGDAAVMAKLKRDRVVTLRGDWTNRSAAIAGELSRYGRSGVPLYLLYPAGENRRATVLPQLLTPGIVLAALERQARD